MEWQGPAPSAAEASAPADRMAAQLEQLLLEGRLNDLSSTGRSLFVEFEDLTSRSSSELVGKAEWWTGVTDPHDASAKRTVVGEVLNDLVKPPEPAPAAEGKAGEPQG